MRLYNRYKIVQFIKFVSDSEFVDLSQNDPAENLIWGREVSLRFVKMLEDHVPPR